MGGRRQPGRRWRHRPIDFDTAATGRRAGYERAIIQMTVDGIGMGKGRWRPRRGSKPNAGATGVTVDAYADKPSIRTVTRIFS